MTEREFDVLVVGELNPDVIVVDDDPRPRFGQAETIVEAISLVVGSSSAIFACGAARLGLRTAFVGVVGEDVFGRFTLGALAERGVDVSRCVVAQDRPTGASVILARGPDRAVLTSIGTIDALRADEVPLELVRRARHLHVGSTYLQASLRPGLPSLLGQARAAGLSTSFDCNWDPTDAWDGSIDELLTVADLFLPNSAEARRLTGAVDDRTAAAELMRRGGLGPRNGGPHQSGLTVAVKRGPKGALAVRGTEFAAADALPVRVVDTTGAGDSFNAGMVFGWLAGWSLEAALELGVACGSLSCRELGGTASQPTLEEARQALADLGRVR